MQLIFLHHYIKIHNNKIQKQGNKLLCKNLKIYFKTRII